MNASEERQLQAEADAYQAQADYQRDRLAAAAPELLRVVRVVADWAIMGADKVYLSSLMPDQSGDETLADAARAAIREAEGRP